MYNGIGSYASEEQYWCSLCNKIHTRLPGSEEDVWKTGWHTVEGMHYNIGFCNGAHRTPDAPKYLGGTNILYGVTVTKLAEKETAATK